MWIVMTSSAKMPSRCWGRYRNVALVKLTQHATAWGIMPKQISPRDRAVHEIRHMGHHSEGKTGRCAYQRVKAEAERRALALNSADPVDQGEMFTWGGSA